MTALKAGRPSAKTTIKQSLSDFEEKKEFKRINFDVDAKTHQKFKVYCIQNDKTMADILTAYIESIVEQERL